MELSITPDTMVAELKTVLAEAHNIPLQERRKYAIFVRRSIFTPYPLPTIIITMMKNEKE